MNTEQIVLASRPVGLPTPVNFKVENATLPELQKDEVLLQGMFYSVDPYMRGRMNAGESYVPPFEIDKPLEGGVIAKVVTSKSEKFKTGDVVSARLPWQVQAIAPAKVLQRVDETLAPASYYLGILGMPGLTAYFGFLKIGKPKKGETVVISGAAGAVGIVVGQLAKIYGCRVIGIAGTDDKAELLIKEFGFNDVINYKDTKDINATLKETCPAGVDVYFDNVGGEISDAVVRQMKRLGRVILCGQIALYNSTEIPMGPRLQPILLTKSILMQGFIVGNYQAQFPEGIQQLGTWLREGKLKYKETIVEGFHQLPDALLGLFKGDNTGKMVVQA